MYMLLMGDLEKSEMEILTEVFQKGLNIEQVSESLSNTMLILRNGVLSNTLDAKSLKAGFSKYQHDDPPNRGKNKEQGKDYRNASLVES